MSARSNNKKYTRSESKYFVTVFCDAIARDDELTYEKFLEKIHMLS